MPDFATLHVILTHFPIALFMVSFAVEWLRTINKLNISPHVSLVCLTFGCLGATCAVPIGWLAASVYGTWNVVLWHKIMGIILTLFSYGVFWVYLKNKKQGLKLVMIGLLCLFTLITGFLGGEIVRPQLLR